MLPPARTLPLLAPELDLQVGIDKPHRPACAIGGTFLASGKEEKMALRTKFVKAGGWRTLEWYWNVTTTVFFRAPATAEVKIRYFCCTDRQKQTLDGDTIKKLSVSWGSLFSARVQILVAEDVNVTYDVEPGNVAVMPPGIKF
jgi:hypothetical protein